MTCERAFPEGPAHENADSVCKTLKLSALSDFTLSVALTKISRDHWRRQRIWPWQGESCPLYQSLSLSIYIYIYIYRDRWDLNRRDTQSPDIVFTRAQILSVSNSFCLLVWFTIGSGRADSQDCCSYYWSQNAFCMYILEIMFRMFLSIYSVMIRWRGTDMEWQQSLLLIHENSRQFTLSQIRKQLIT